MIRKLQKNFILIAILSVVLVLVILIGSINVFSFRNLIADADEILSIISENDGKFPAPSRRRGSNSATSGSEPNEKPSRDTRSDRFNNQFSRISMDLSEELPYQSRFFTVVYSKEGVFQSLNLERIAAVDEQLAKEYAAAVFGKTRTKGFYQNYRYLIDQKDDKTLLIFLSCSKELSTFYSSLTDSVIISVVGIVAVFILIVIFSGRITKPIAESYEKQKRFITDAGHELKTPITIINADVDVLEMDIPDNEWLQDIRQQTNRLGTLTKDLIYLSKMEEDGIRSVMIDFSLSDTVSETIQSFQSVCMSQEKTLEMSIQPLLTFCGDESAVRKLVSILMDNALKYSPEHSVIQAALIREGRQAKLTIQNQTMAPVDAAAATHLFDRFYRVDASRNSSTGGFGLGLSIAKAVVESYHGKIRAISANDGRSISFEVTLPLQ